MRTRRDTHPPYVPYILLKEGLLNKYQGVSGNDPSTRHDSSFDFSVQTRIDALFSNKHALDRYSRMGTLSTSKQAFRLVGPLSARETISFLLMYEASYPAGS